MIKSPLSSPGQHIAIWLYIRWLWHNDFIIRDYGWQSSIQLMIISWLSNQAAKMGHQMAQLRSQAKGQGWLTGWVNNGFVDWGPPFLINGSSNPNPHQNIPNLHNPHRPTPSFEPKGCSMWVFGQRPNSSIKGSIHVWLWAKNANIGSTHTKSPCGQPYKDMDCHLAFFCKITCQFDGSQYTTKGSWPPLQPSSSIST